MKIVNECCFETKAMKDLNCGEVFMYGAVPYMRILALWTDRPDKMTYAAIDFNGKIKYFYDPNAEVRMLDAELHIKYRKRDEVVKK